MPASPHRLLPPRLPRFRVSAFKSALSATFLLLGQFVPLPVGTGDRTEPVELKVADEFVSE